MSNLAGRGLLTIGAATIDGSAVTSLTSSAARRRPSTTPLVKASTRPTRDEVVARFPNGGAAEVDRAVQAARAAFPAGPRPRPRSAPTCSTRSARPSWRAPRSSANCSRARKARRCAEAHRRGHARRAHLQVLRRRGAAPSRPDARIDPSRHRRLDLPRGGRCLRPDHAVEFPDRDPGVEVGAGARVRQYAWC